MLTILDEMHSSDYFNIIVFNKLVLAWQADETLVPASSSNIQLAKQFIAQIEPKGGWYYLLYVTLFNKVGHSIFILKCFLMIFTSKVIEIVLSN